MRDPAGSLCWVLLRTPEKRKHRNRVQIARLFRQAREIDRAAVDTRRRSGLQPALRQLQFLQPRCQREGRRIAGATRRIVLQPDVDQAVQKRAGRQDHRLRAEADSRFGHDAGDAVARDLEIVDGLLKEAEIGLVLESSANRAPIEDAVRLRAGRANGGALRTVQNAELDSRFVRCRRHRAVESIDFLDQMPLADPADRRIAGHLPKRLDRMRDQQRSCAHPRCGERGLGACVAAADDDDFEFRWKAHRGYRFDQTKDRWNYRKGEA
jgi:hypothetical protein